MIKTLVYEVEDLRFVEQLDTPKKHKEEIEQLKQLIIQITKDLLRLRAMLPRFNEVKGSLTVMVHCKAMVGWLVVAVG